MYMLSWQWKPARACSSSSLSKELVRSCGLRRADVEWHAHAMRQMCWLARPRRRGAPDGPEARTVWEVSYLALTLCAGESSGLAVGVGRAQCSYNAEWLARPRRRGSLDGPEARTAWGVSTYPFRCAPESSGSVLPVGGGAGLGAVSRAGMM